MYNGHLSIEEVEQLNQQKGPAENQSHLENCRQCHALLEKYQAVSAKLDKLASIRIGAKNGMNCPDERVWFDVAGGTLSSEESLKYVQHASECDKCGRRLRDATHLFDDTVSAEEEQIISSIPSASRQVQKKLASQLTTIAPIGVQLRRQSISDSIPWWRRFSRPAYALPTLIVLVSVVGLAPKIYTEIQLYYANKSVREAFMADRRMPYRPAVAPYGPDEEERGPAATGLTITIPDSAREPCLSAEGEFLEHDYQAAINILSRSPITGKDSECALNDLAVAYALKADYSHDNLLYQRALEVLQEIIDRHSDNATAYFNQAMIFEQLGQREAFCKSIRRFLELEHGTGWSNEAERLACK